MSIQSDEVVLKFFRLPASSAFFAGIDAEVASLSPILLLVAKSFRQNLWGAVSTLEMPYTLAFAGAWQERLNRLFLAEIHAQRQNWSERSTTDLTLIFLQNTKSELETNRRLGFEVN